MMIVAALAQKLDASEAALRLLLGILAGYPIAAIYRLTLESSDNKCLKQAYFTFCGLAIGIFNYGADISHSILAVLVSYALQHLLQHRHVTLMIALNWCFHMPYLLVGYYYTENNDYDISWTMPHCVLVLRLIGLAYDIADGKRANDKLSRDQREAAIQNAPNLLELSTFVYFPSAFLVGPQFSIRRLQRFINGEFREYAGSTSTGLLRCGLGLIYMTVWQIGSGYFPDEYFISSVYFTQPLWRKLVYQTFWAKFTLCKYISCWLLSEGALISLGFTFNGKNEETGEVDWSGCANVRVKCLETGNPMYNYVASFNVNTNQWVSNYVYKRLKFLNNRNISYAAALTFLALWHGFHDGYYMAFFIEYMIVTTEKQMENVYGEVIIPKYGRILDNSIPFAILKGLVLKLYHHIYTGWCLTPFILLSHDRYLKAFGAVYYFGFVFCGIWFVIYQIYLYHMRTKKRINAAQKRDLTKVD